MSQKNFGNAEKAGYSQKVIENIVELYTFKQSIEKRV